MTVASQPARYNLRIPHMHGRWSGGLRIGWLAAFFLAATLVPALLSASVLGDAGRQLAHKISSVTGPGAIALEITNRSSLDEKAVREVRSALEAELRTGGVRTAAADESMGSVQRGPKRVVTSEVLIMASGPALCSPLNGVGLMGVGLQP